MLGAPKQILNQCISQMYVTSVCYLYLNYNDYTSMHHHTKGKKKKNLADVLWSNITLQNSRIHHIFRTRNITQLLNLKITKVISFLILFMLLNSSICATLTFIW